MRLWLTLFAALAVTGCASPRAPENPNSVPNVLLSINQLRATSGAIYATGGLFDGAAIGQKATFVALPDGRLICTFEVAPTQPEAVGTTTAHRLTAPGLHAALSAAILPNLATPEVEYLTNFTVQANGPAGPTVSTTGFGDPRFDRLRAVFAQYPTPCWRFAEDTDPRT